MSAENHEEKTNPEKLTKINVFFKDGDVKQFAMNRTAFNLVSHALIFIGGLALGCYLGNKQ